MPDPIELQPGDGALLCSDGVWELLDDVTLAELHRSSDTLESWRDKLKALIEKSMPAGHDNFSAVLVRVSDPEDEPDSSEELSTVRPLI